MYPQNILLVSMLLAGALCAPVPVGGSKTPHEVSITFDASGNPVVTTNQKRAAPETDEAYVFLVQFLDDGLENPAPREVAVEKRSAPEADEAYEFSIKFNDVQ